MTPTFQAQMDWRDEGEFIPSRYPAGSKEQNEYLAEMAAIRHDEEFNYEHSSIDIGKERNWQERIAS